MKISLNWLQDFVELKTRDAEKIKAVITAATAEVETMESLGKDLENIVLGRIEKIGAHPNADALKLCTVYDGKEKLQVVCGGSNLREGMRVAFGRIGAVVRWHGTEVVKLEKAKIRGQESFGMICASDEIGLAEMFPKHAEKEIVDLSHLEAPLGTPLAKTLGLDDVVIHIDNHALTNRSDLFSHRGFAREFTVNGLATWKKGPKAWAMPKNNTPPPLEVKIEKSSTCTRYCAVYLTGIEIKESPDWIKQRLIAVGIRPLNNIVDITNYIMMEWGMPLHAFDVEQLKGSHHVMRLSKAGEKVVTLDQVERTLPNDVVVLADENEIYDLCGIMGGYQSGIKPKTSKIWLHAPIYDPVLVRRASRGMGHVTEASIMYEKGVYPVLAMEALKAAVKLILEFCPNAQVGSRVVDIKNYKETPRKLKLRQSQLERLIGCAVKPKDTERILKELGFGVTKQKDGFTVAVPDFRRNDINLEADLIEEIARIHGYDNIPFTTPVADLTPTPTNPRRELEKTIKDQLVGMGFNEIYTFAFLGPELLKKCGLAPNSATIELENPISSDVSLMRQTLLPRMLETIEKTWRHEERFRLFELSKTYCKGKSEPEERAAWIMATAGEDFRILQGIVETMGLTVEHVSGPDHSPAHHPGRRAVLTVHGKTTGWLYEVHPQVLKAYDIKIRVVAAEVDLETIHAMKLARWPKFRELPRFPAVKLDVSIAIPKRELAARYFDVIAKTDKTLIRDIDLIDEYEGEKIEGTQRGLTYSITYRSDERTLTEEEVNKIHVQVIQNLKNAGAAIRM